MAYIFGNDRTKETGYKSDKSWFLMKKLESNKKEMNIMSINNHNVPQIFSFTFPEFPLGLLPEHIAFAN